MSTAAISEATIKRLRWRCRRGTHELDALLGGWLEANGARADAHTLTAFDALLDQPDPQIWDWLMGRVQPPRDDWRMLVAQMRVEKTQ